MAEELRRLAQDIDRVPVETWPHIERALAGTAHNIKTDWANNLGGANNRGSAFRHIGGSVDYTVAAQGASLIRRLIGGVGGGTGFEAEIGPNLARRQGPMAGWFEEGMRNIPALHAGHAAMKSNEEDFERGLANALDDGLKDAGLL